MDLMYWIILVTTYLIVSLLSWLYGKYRMLNSFKRRGIKGPKPNLVLGNRIALRYSGKLPHQVIGDWIEEYGPIFGYYGPSKCRLVINDALLLKKIYAHKAFQDREKLVLSVKPLIDSLLSVRGETWRRSRKTISPVFSSPKVNSPPLSTVVDSCINKFLSALNPNQLTEPFTLDIVDKIHSFTFDVICRTSLAMEGDFYSKDDQLMDAVKEFFQFSHNNAVMLAEIFPLFASLLTFINNKLTMGRMTDSIVKHLRKVITDYIDNQGVADDKSKTDAALLRAMLKHLAEGNLTQEELLGNIYLIVLAGFEATANALIFCLYLLAKHQDIQEEFRENLAEESNAANYAEMIWLETLRYYPPVVLVLNRQASQDVVIDELTIEKDWIVEAPVWQIHHSKEYWPDPWTFNPHRFSPKNRKNIEPAAFLPFGTGGRTCLGMSLANSEARKLLTQLISKYRISFCAETMVPIRFKCTTAVLNPDGPVFLTFDPIS